MNAKCSPFVTAIVTDPLGIIPATEGVRNVGLVSLPGPAVSFDFEALISAILGPAASSVCHRSPRDGGFAAVRRYCTNSQSIH